MANTQTKQTLTPLGNRVVAKRLQAEETTKGGIIIPDSAKKKQERAIVVAVGPGAAQKDGSFRQIPVKIGDQILFESYAGHEMKLNDEDLLIINADEILGLIQ